MNTFVYPPPSVLSRELANEHHIYLHRCYSRGWVAYEQSARNLHLLLPHISTYRHTPKGWSQEVETLIVPQLSLDLLMEKNLNVSRTSNDNQLVIAMPRLM